MTIAFDTTERGAVRVRLHDGKKEVRRTRKMFADALLYFVAGLVKKNHPDLIAVGVFKVSVAPKHEGRGWKCEIHQIVSGAKKTELEKIFSSSRPAAGNFLRVKEVTNLAQAISDVLKRDVQGWRHPYRTEITPDRPKKVRRAEYYEWLLGLSSDERMVRYGCDRYFNKLKKKPRVVRVKVPKKPHILFSYSHTCLEAIP